MHSRPLLFAKVMRWLALYVLALGALGVHARAMQNAPLEKIASLDVVCTPVRAAQVLDSTQENSLDYGGCTSWGIYMQTDPIGYKDDFNLYAYTGNDPVNKTDPTGLSTNPIADVWNKAFNTNQAGLPADGAKGFELAKQGIVEGAVEGVKLSAQVGMTVSTLGVGGVAANAAKGVANPVSETLARVVPGNLNPKTLGSPSAADVFVTNASELRGLSAKQIAEKLSIPESSSFRVIEFPSANVQGIASPIGRTNPGFIPGGRTAGGASEFVIPNGPIPRGAVDRIVP